MTHTNFSKSIFLIRSKIRLLRYAIFNQAHYNDSKSSKFAFFNKKTHPVTLGPEQLSRFFAYIANTEH